MDFAIGNLLSYFYFKQESGLQYRTTYSIEKTTADVLIFGSSRANHHYKPEVFEKELNLNYYNVGRDGSSILYHYAVLNAILKRYIPKMIILDLNDSEFRQSQETYERLSSLLPYYRKHPEIRSIIELRSKYEKYKLYSSIYPYNSVLSTIIIGNTKRNKERKGDNLGYIPLNMTWTEEIKINNNEEKYPIDSLKVKMFLGFVTKCKSANIRLYVVFSPFYVKYIREDYSVKLAKEITKKYNIIFFDYSNDSTFITKKSFFADFGHLNDQGAKFFSKKIIEQIKKTSSIKATN
ncbi:MAG: hypothetical protein WCK78_02970 [Paludibacter sp.]